MKGRQDFLGLRVTPQYQKLSLRSKPILYSQLWTGGMSSLELSLWHHHREPYAALPCAQNL